MTLTAAETDVRRAVKLLAGASGDMDTLTRLSVMRALFNSITTSARFGTEDRHALIRLAAHAIVWADERDADA